ncbi:hypothetical protein ACFL0L_05620, partial [Patescibacteria group bacterium]
LFLFAPRLWPRNTDTTRSLLIIILILCTVFLSTVAFIAARQVSEPHEWVHDSTIMTEEAMKFALAGRNPYSEDYRITPLADWPWNPDGRENPALDHYAYLPGMFMSGLPFFAFIEKALGWYDHRLFQLIALALLLFVFMRMQMFSSRIRQLLLIVFFLNPFFFYYFIVGHNDIVMYLLLIAAISLLSSKRFLWASVCIGIALSMKHVAWLFLPLMLVYYFLQAKGYFKDRIRWVITKGWPIIILPALFILPFVFAHAQVFVDDTVLYLTGDSTSTYPIQGIGLPAILLHTGHIANMWELVSFFWIQLVLMILVIGTGIFVLKKNPALHWVVIISSLLLFVLWFFARSFSLSHLAVIIQFIIVGLFLFPGQAQSKSAN